jgi:hypothetical protein
METYPAGIKGRFKVDAWDRGRVGGYPPPPSLPIAFYRHARRDKPPQTPARGAKAHLLQFSVIPTKQFYCLPCSGRGR